MHEVIIDEVKFYVNGFEGEDYFVHAYAQDPADFEQYTCEISKIDEDGDLDLVDTIYFDSCGNLEEGQDTETPIIVTVLNILLSDKVCGIIRGF